LSEDAADCGAGAVGGRGESGVGSSGIGRLYGRAPRFAGRLRYNWATVIEEHPLATASTQPPIGVFARIVRALSIGRRAAGRGLVEFYSSSNLTFASSIAYYTLLSMFPFVLLILSIVSKLAVKNSPTTLVEIIARALPRHFDFVVDRVHELAAAPLKLSVLGTAVTLWASMGVFGALTSAVNHAWGVERNYSYWKHKLISFVMLLTAGLLMLAAVTFSGAAEVARARWFEGILTRWPTLQWLSGLISHNASTPVFVVVVGLIYYFAPNTRVRLRDVWFGAILAGLLWRLAFEGFSWYVRDLSRFSVDGSIAAVVAFLVWVYLSAVILLYGVEVTAAYARLRKEVAD
jgi:membrane protein